ncbi:MAG: glycosyltransferase [bacterium]
MLKNPIEYTETSFYQKHFSQRKVAQKIYENFVLLHLKKYTKNYSINNYLKNILHLNTAVGRGGAAKIAYNYLNRNFNKLGYNSKLLAGMIYCNQESDIELIKCKNLNIHKLLHKYQRNSGLLDFYNLASFDIPEMEVFKNADIIHLHNLHGSYFSPFMLPQLTSLKPTIWTLHDEQSYTGHCAYAFDCKKWLTGCGNCPDLNFYPKIKNDTTEFLLKTKKKIYDMSYFSVVCPSNWLANRAKQSILQNKDIRVIYNGVNEKIFINADKMESRKALKLPLDKKILMFSASGSINNPQKGGKYFFEAYNRLKNDHNILFLNIGGGDSSRIKKNWIDIPYINDENTMALYYSASDLFIYPSMAETFGLVIAEAMSCGTPVVAFNNTAIPEIVDHLQTGYLAENKNIDDFIHGINLFLNNDELRKAAILKSRQKIVKYFTLDKMIQNYIDLYNEILSKEAIIS